MPPKLPFHGAHEEHAPFAGKGVYVSGKGSFVKNTVKPLAPPGKMAGKLERVKELLVRARKVGVLPPHTTVRVLEGEVWVRMPLLNTHPHPPEGRQAAFESWLPKADARRARELMREKLALIRRELGEPAYDAKVEHNWGFHPNGQLYLHDLHFVDELEHRVRITGW